MAKLHSEGAITPVSTSCTIYIILFSLFFTINIGIGTYFVHYQHINHDKKQLLRRALFLKQQFTKQINGKYQTN